MKIQYAKLIVEQGQFETNFTKIKKAICHAKEDKYDMIVFSTNCISGIFNGDYVFNADIKNEIESYNEKIKSLSQDIYVVWGNLYEDYQAILVSKNDELYVTTKQNRDDRFFYESKYFKEKEAELITINDIKIGFYIPTNTHHFHILFTNNEVGYNQNVQLNNGIIINHFGVENINKNVVCFDGKISLYQNNECIKIENELIEKVFDINTMKHYEHSLLEKIIFILRLFDKQVFNAKINWIIGLSGGLDSSINAALLVLALGKERVIGYNLATKYNSKKTISIAEKLALKLQIKYHDGNIEKLVNATKDVLNDYGHNNITDLALQNIQARIRGHLLSSFASIQKGVVINNGNKVETALGYATMQGDLIGALAPIADLTKVQLFEIAKMINDKMNDEIISNDLLPQKDLTWIQKPSAELAKNQFDPMKWFYHDYIIEHLGIDFTINDLLKMYLENNLPPQLSKWINYYGLNDPKLFIEDIEWLVTTMNRNAYKLVVAPLIVSLSLSTFGSDKSIIQGTFENKEYTKLKNKILKNEAN